MNIGVNDEIELVSLNRKYTPQLFPLFMEEIDKLKNIFTFADDTYTLEEEERFIECLGEDSRFNFHILYHGEPCGKIGLYEHDESVRKINVCYWVALGYKRKGIAYQSVRRVIEYAFSELNINRIQLLINIDNTESRNLARKLGFVCEGELRDNDYVNGRFHTQKIYACLAADYFKSNADGRQAEKGEFHNFAAEI